jgi:hypothetical protein
MRPLLVTFVGGEQGSWAIEWIETVAGAPLERALRLEVMEGEGAGRLDRKPAWALRGVTSNERYVSRVEHRALVAGQEPLGRVESTRAALIPITKSEACGNCLRMRAAASSGRAPITSRPDSSTYRRSPADCTTAATSASPSTS